MTKPQALMHRRTVLKLASAGAFGLATGQSLAQGALPAQAKIFVGFPPGGAPDIVARKLAELLTGKLAATVLVENRPGAGGRIALDAARQSPPDGLTLMLTPAGLLTTNPYTYKKLTYDPFTDLTPIAQTTILTFGFAVGPAVPPQVKDIESFAAWVKSQSGSVVFGTPAAGAPPHFIGDVLSRTLKLGLTHVPYRGGGPAFNDLFGNSIASVSLTLGDMIKHHESKRLRIIAVSGAKRSSFLPSIPTFGEQGVKGLDRDDWFGIYIGGKASPEVVQRISALSREVQTGAAYQKAMRDSYLEPTWSTPAELDALARADNKHWGPIVKASGFQADS